MASSFFCDCGPLSQSGLWLAALLSPLSEQIMLMMIIHQTDGRDYKYSSLILHSNNPVCVVMHLWMTNVSTACIAVDLAYNKAPKKNIFVWILVAPVDQSGSVLPEWRLHLCIIVIKMLIWLTWQGRLKYFGRMVRGGWEEWRDSAGCSINLSFTHQVFATWG